MENLIVFLNIGLAVLLVIVILLQKSEGGALGLGASQESLVSSRAAGSFLSKSTAIIATLFIVTSIMLTILTNKNLPQISVIDKLEDKEDSNLPEIPESKE